LTSGGSVTQAGTGTISGTGLTVSAAAGIILENANTVSGPVSLTKTGTGTGNISFTDGAALAVTVAARNQNTGMGTITIVNQNGITVGSGDIVNDGTGLVRLTAASGPVIEASGGIIQGADLTVSSGGVITLNEANKVSGPVSLINNSTTTGSISFKQDSTAPAITVSADNKNTGSGTITIENPAGLTVGTADIKNDGTGDITLTSTVGTTGAIIINGAITGSGANVVSITSGNDSNIIFQSGSSVSNVGRLVLRAGTRTTPSYSTGDVTFTSSTINVSGNGTEGVGSAAVYLWAKAVSVSGGSITPGTSGQACLWVDSTPSISSGSISGNRYHVHPRNGGHVVYMDGPDPGNNQIPDGDGYMLDNTVSGREYFYIQSDSSLPDPFPPCDVPANRNAYIIDVGHQDRALTFECDTGNGFIEIRGAYQSNGALTLTPGSRGVRLSNSDVTPANPAVVNLTASDFTLPAGTNLELRGGTNPASPASITATAITLRTVTGSGHLVNNLTLNAGTGAVSVTGNMGTSSTAALGNIRIATAAGASFGGSIWANSFTQAAGTGTTQFAAAQNYNGVNSTGNAFDFAGSGNLIIGNTLTTSYATGTGGRIAINNTGAFTLNGAIIATGSFGRTGSGANNIGADITTNNSTPAYAAISFPTGSTLTLAGNITLKSYDTDATHGGAISLDAVSRDSTVGRTLALNAGGGNVAVSGAMGTSGTEIGNITVTGNTVGFSPVNSTGKITLTNADLFTANGAIVANGGFEQTNTGSGTSLLKAGITSSGTGILFRREISLDAATIQLSTGAGAGNIDLTTVIGTVAGRNLTLLAGTGSINITGAIGTSGTRLGILTITSAANATFSSSGSPAPIYAASFSQAAGTGITTFNGTQDYTAGFSFTGTNLAVNNTLTAGMAVSIPSAANVTFAAAAAVNAASFNQAAGTGITTFNGTQDYTAYFTFAGNRLTVDNTLETDTDTSGGDGNITITVSGAGTPLFTVGSYGGILPGGSGTGGKITVNGNTSNNGTITAVTTDIAVPVEFNGNYTSAAAGNLVGSINAAAQTLIFKGNAAFGAFTHNGDTVQFSTGSAATHNVSQAGTNPPVLADVIIDTGNTVTVVSGTTIIQGPAGTAALTLTGSAQLNAAAGTWYIGPPSGLPSSWYMLSNPSASPTGDTNYVNSGPAFSGGFAGFNGTLTMGNGAVLTTKDFYTQMTNASPANTFTLNAPSAASTNCTISASGNVTVNETFVNVIHSTLTMTGNSGELAVRTHRSGASVYPRIVDVELGNFVADGGNNATDATVINSWVLFAGENAVTIETNKYLKAYFGSDAYIQVNPGSTLTTAKWVQKPGAVFHVDSAIKPIVEFGVQGYASPGRTFEISGTTTWHDLICKEPGATLKFSNHPDLHSVAGEFVVVPLDAAGTALQGGGGAGTNPYMILLTRLNNTGLTPPVTPDTQPPPAVTVDFWHFELKSGAKLSFNYAYVQYSWAKNRIPLPLAGQAIILAIPYVYMAPPLPGTPNYTLGNPRADSSPIFAAAVEQSYYNHNWLVANNFFYSFTEDSDGNGRIDRIRAQAAFELTGDTENSFSNFSVVVDGYKVNTSKGINGYRRVDEDPAHSTLPTVIQDLMKDMIYIYLEEKGYSDTRAPLTWRVERNTSLKDFATQSIAIGLPEHGTMTTWDTAPPRINYALTMPPGPLAMPRGPEIYVQFSEPVDIPAGGVTTDAPPVAGPYQPAGAGGEDIFIPLDQAYTLIELVQPAASYPKFTVTGVRDRAAFVPDLRSQPNVFYSYLYPSPKYPRDWTYKEYVEITGDGSVPYPFAVVAPSFGPHLPFIKDWAVGGGNYLDNRTGAGPATPPIPPTQPGTPYGTDTHRVTDLLVSVPPTKTTDTQYFVWPLWAKYNNLDPEDYGDTTGGIPGSDYGYMTPGTGNRPFNDTTIIWDFTGKRFLEHSDDILLQSRVNDALTGTVPRLVFAFNIPDSYRASAVHGSPGLWLPDSLSPPAEFSNMVPWFYPFSSSPLMTSVIGSSELFNYKLGKNQYPASKANVDFFFNLSGVPDDLFVGRLDIAPGEAIPSSWYRLVRPFTFELHDITRQRGGVTILNNVINSEKRERVFLDYRLTKSGRVTVQVFTLDGNLVKVLVRESQSAKESYYRVSWDGTNNGGRPVARGMYFIRIVAPEIDEIRKVMVIK
jgi:hypothetical protein